MYGGAYCLAFLGGFMSETKTKPKQEAYIALKNLCTLGGKQVKRGESFKCYKEEAQELRYKGAI